MVNSRNLLLMHHAALSYEDAMREILEAASLYDLVQLLCDMDTFIESHDGRSGSHPESQAVMDAKKIRRMTLSELLLKLAVAESDDDEPF